MRLRLRLRLLAGWHTTTPSHASSPCLSCCLPGWLAGWHTTTPSHTTQHQQSLPMQRLGAQCSAPRACIFGQWLHTKPPPLHCISLSTTRPAKVSPPPPNAGFACLRVSLHADGDITPRGQRKRAQPNALPLSREARGHSQGVVHSHPTQCVTPATAGTQSVTIRFLKKKRQQLPPALPPDTQTHTTGTTQ